MFVKIGPYCNGIRLYNYLEKIEWLIGEHNVDRLYDWLQPVLDETINRILERDRTIKVVVHPYDTWNAEQTLAYVILPVLEQYRDTTHSCPMIIDDEDLPPEVRAVTGDEANDIRWKWVLDEMIWAFSQVNEDWEDQYFSGVSDRRRVPVDPNDPDGPQLNIEGPNHTRKIDQEGIDNHMKRMANGFRLFGRYYMHLWD